MLTFYSNPISSNALKVQLFLEYAQIPHTTKIIDLAKGEQLGESFLKINPFSGVPAIDDDGFHLAESAAILRYLAQRFEVVDAYPEDLKQRAVIDQLLDMTTLHISRWVQSIFWNAVLAPMFKMPVHPTAIEDAKVQLDRYLPKLNRWLNGSEGYLCGPKPSIADLAFIPLLAQARDLKLDWSKHTNVHSYAQRALALPAWKNIEVKISQIFAGR